MSKVAKISIIVACSVLLVIGGFLLTRGESFSGTIQSLEVLAGEAVISMTDKGFDPNEIKIKKGTKVKFVNKDTGARWPASDLHPSHGIYPGLDPKRPIPAGESWEFIFDKVGEWGFHDHLSPYITGKIIVVR